MKVNVVSKMDSRTLIAAAAFLKAALGLSDEDADSGKLEKQYIGNEGIVVVVREQGAVKAAAVAVSTLCNGLRLWSIAGPDELQVELHAKLDEQAKERGLIYSSREIVVPTGRFGHEANQLECSTAGYVALLAADDVPMLQECARLQGECFGYEPIDWFGPKILQKIVALGGFVVGAFDTEDKLVGFSIVCPTSRGYHVLREGVLPEFRGRGFSRKMREYQGIVGCSRGVFHMDLTFDPRTTSAAGLNVNAGGRLHYKENLYGRDVTTGDLSHRWWVEFDLQNLSSPEAPELATIARALDVQDGLPVVNDDIWEEENVLLLAPADWTDRRRQGVDRELLNEWQEVFFPCLLELLDSGFKPYRVVMVDDQYAAYVLGRTVS